VEAATPARYRPFSLAAFEPGRAPSMATWNGRTLTSRELGPEDMPLISSGWSQDAAEASRRASFAELSQGGTRPLNQELLLRFHGSHDPERGPFSPCMHRRDAATVSMSWIRVRPREVTFTYVDGPPCRTEIPAPHRLART
ncbi:MAG: hypothetical protein OEQ13_03625, partial [Acidobacteriota bacterium]|nr:hypothetical protein [Acidobacteriota bacterium]